MDDVLVLVRNCEMWEPHVRYAADLAEKLHGSLNGICVLPGAIPLPTNAPAAFARELIEIYREDAVRARRADVPFRRWATDRGVRHSTWRVASGATSDILAAAANWHDVLVLEARPEPTSDEFVEIGSVLLRAGLPCILVPPGVDRLRLNTVAVAWNGSTQSARAVQAALPLLRGADRIVIVRATSGDPAGSGDRCEIDGFLQRHELHAEHVDIQASEHAAGAAILACAAQHSADLLVLGAYGRTRFSEWFFGGVTRYMLQHAALPLFMAH